MRRGGYARPRKEPDLPEQAPAARANRRAREGDLNRGATPKDDVGYQALIETAMKGVMRAALKKTSAMGALPGEHHFYVTFRTRTPGVQMADHLKDRFPDEMTIVIQHQYWDFEVHEERFEIILKFGGVPQHLRVPFAAVTRFFDPSVNFALQFNADASGLPLEAARKQPAQPSVPAPLDAVAADPAEPEGSTVVSLDAFRRK